MPIRVKVSPTIVNNIAKIYQVTSRIFMEYIDNALDSAEKLYNYQEQSYERDIDITVKIDYQNKTIVIEDNCLGMDRLNLLRIVQNIGESNKKNDFVTSGQFGFGIHAYCACAHRLEVTSLDENSNMANKITIDRTAYTEDGEIADIKEIPRNKFKFQSGTIVRISEFDPEWWKDVDPQVIKKEIERHFEGLLAREGLNIKLIYNHNYEDCLPFNYNLYPGITIEREINSLSIDTWRTKRTKNLSYPLKIFLKITNDIIPDKRPIFINKGRRIEEVQSIKSFRAKSTYRTGLWGHSNLVGYIDVGGMISPNLQRDDFERSQERQMIYEELLRLEKEIYDKLQALNKRTEDANMGKLEDLLSKALSKLANQDRLRFRPQILPGEDLYLVEEADSDIIFKKPITGGKGTVNTKTDFTENTPVDISHEDTEIKGKERKKGGFNVKFSAQERKKADGTLLRSDFIEGDAIYIYRTHPDFIERIKRSRQGDMLITNRLISYLASEIAVHYKDKFFSLRGKQPEVQAILNQRKDLFVDMIEFIYLYESMLQPYVNMNLITLESGNDINGEG